MGYVLDELDDIKDASQALSRIRIYISEYNGYKPMMWTNEKASMLTDQYSWLIAGIAQKYSNNSEIMMEAIKFDADNIRYIGNNLINNVSFILEAYSANPRILDCLYGKENLEKLRDILISQKTQENNFENSNEASNKKL